MAYGGRFSKAEVAAFWKHVTVRGPTQCWLWHGPVRDGCGSMSFGKRGSPYYRRERAHRVSAQLAGLDIVDRNVVQTCKEAMCVNPFHLLVRRHPLAPADVVTELPKGYNHPPRNEFPLTEFEIDQFAQVLRPLRSGTSVHLEMENPKYKNLRNYKGTKAKSLVILTPGDLLSLNPESVIVAIIGSGSCVVWPRRQRKIADLVLAGMPAKLADVLMQKLHLVFTE